MPVAQSPYWVTYDPANHDLYVADFAPGEFSGVQEVSVVDPALARVVDTIVLPTTGSQEMVANSSGYVYYGDNVGRVYSINPHTNQITTATNITTGCGWAGCYPTPIAYDPATGDIFTADVNSVGAIRNGTFVASVRTDSTPSGGVYDPANGNVYVVSQTGNMTAINGSTLQVVATYPLSQPGPGVVYDATNGDLYVCGSFFGSGNVVTVISPQPWRVVATIPVGPACGADALDPSNGLLYVPNEYSVVNGSNVWGSNVTVISTQSNSVVSILPVQTAPVGVAYDPGNGRVYVADAATNNLSVLPRLYPVTFSAVGWLLPGTTWNVTVGNLTLGSSGSEIPLDEPNGTYGFAVTVPGNSALRLAGEWTVNGGTTVVDLRDRVSAYSVTFAETGLSVGTSWWVTLGGTVVRSTTAVANVTEPNGTYAYTIEAVGGYAASSGVVSVRGTATLVSVEFRASSGGSGGIGGIGYGVLGGGAAVLVGGLVILVGRRRRRRAPRSRSGESEE